MTRVDDSRLAEAKQIGLDDVLARLGVGGLKRQGAELIGPCPVCGGTDRFGINTRTLLFQCRRCGMKGGDQVALVQGVMGLGFRDALAWLMGPPVEIDQAERDRRRAKYAEAERRRDAEAERYRKWAIVQGRRMWAQGVPADAPVLRAYLAGRGLPPHVTDALPPTLRFAPRMDYVRRIGGQTVTLHVGPAMLARVDRAGENGVACHVTWIDPARPGKKARIETRIGDNGGAPWEPKIQRGAKKGGVVRLSFNRSDTLIMGEGIETTLTALAADAVPGADYWAGIDLGNMAGRMQRVPGRRISGVPDMSDDAAFVPPPYVRRLIFVQDGDSAAAATRAKLECGLRRAMEMRPGLTGAIVPCPEGADLNDLIQGAA